MASSLEVAAFAGLVSLATLAMAWGESEEPVAWTSTVVGDPYRQQVLERKAPVPFPVRLAAAFAWAVVAVSVSRGLFLVVEILCLEVTRSVASGGDPIRASANAGTSFDALSGGLHGLYLVATAAAIGAFARYARDACRDVNMARRSAPLLASGALVVVALLVAPAGRYFWWPIALVHVGVVLAGAAFVAGARRSIKSLPIKR